jgi:hypothetical protein
VRTTHRELHDDEGKELDIGQVELQVCEGKWAWLNGSAPNYTVAKTMGNRSDCREITLFITNISATYYEVSYL